jgi:hypothetical protein
MCDAHRRQFLGLTVLTLGAAVLGSQAHAAEPPQASAKPKVYTCPPCGCANDGKEFPAPGPCSECGMPLVEKPPTPEKPKADQPAPKAAQPPN